MHHNVTPQKEHTMRMMCIRQKQAQSLCITAQSQTARN